MCAEVAQPGKAPALRAGGVNHRGSSNRSKISPSAPWRCS